MSHDSTKADQIAFHFYTKLFYVLNNARATAQPRSSPKIDKWFNLETPDSDLFPREAREPYKAISLAPPPPLEIQVLLAVPDHGHNHVLVYIAPDSSRVRIEPAPRYILLESWILAFASRRPGDPSPHDVALSTIYKHGIPLFRSLYSLLRVLPAWRLHKRWKRRATTGPRNGHLSIQLRIRPTDDTSLDILPFHTIPSPALSAPLPTATHTFPAVPHPLGSLSLSATYLLTPNFQLDELESILSSRFISADLDQNEDFVPTLVKNQQRDSITGSSLPSRFSLTRSRLKFSATDNESSDVAQRFILPTRTASLSGTPHSPLAALPTTIHPSPVSRPVSNLGTNTTAFPTSTAPLPIGDRPDINLRPFKTNTLSSASGSSPALSIRHHAGGAQSSLPGRISASPRIPPSPIGGGSGGVGVFRPSPPGAFAFAPSSLNDKQRPIIEREKERDDRHFSLSNTSGGGEDGGDRLMPPRKRYSSSFSHRYQGSIGSGGSGGGGGSVDIGNGQAVGPGTGSGHGLLANVAVSDKQERKHGTAGSTGSFLSTATDDDDISVFVQDIDAAKPLSGRLRERERRERDGERERTCEIQQEELRIGQDGETEMCSRGLRDGTGGDHADEVVRDGNDGHDHKDEFRQHVGHPREETWTARQHTQGLSTTTPPNSTSLSPIHGGAVISAAVTPVRPSVAMTLEYEHATSLPVTRTASQQTATTSSGSGETSVSPILTNRADIDERLRRMNETFARTVEVIAEAAGGSMRRRERGRETKGKGK